ncbi:MAG: hypothetical protein WCO56_26785 [Verrucomicrobiota bacterium]
MTPIEQFSLDLDGEKLEHVIQNQWRENMEKDAHNWTPEGMTVAWDFRGDWEEWRALPEYERHLWMTRYERAKETALCHRRMPSPGSILASEEETYQRDKERAFVWAREIKESWLNRSPCPIIPAPGFEYILKWAVCLVQRGEV